MSWQISESGWKGQPWQNIQWQQEKWQGSASELWTPPSDLPFAWYDGSNLSSTIKETNSDIIETELDLSDQGYDMPGENNPLTGIERVNGGTLNVLSMCQDSWLSVAPVTMPASGNICFEMVARVDFIDNNGDALTSYDASTADFSLNAGSNTQFDGLLRVAGNSDVPYIGGPFDGRLVMLGGQLNFDEGLIKTYTNGELGNTGAYTVKVTNDGPQRLRLFANRGSFEFPCGVMGEIFYFEDYSLQREVQGYMAWKWGLSGDLWAGHRYKPRAPINSDLNPGPSFNNDFNNDFN